MEGEDGGNLKGKNTLPESLIDREKDAIMKRAHSAIQLGLSDEVLRQLVDIKATDQPWKRLEKQQLHKSFPNRLFLKQKLYTFRMEKVESLDKQPDSFNKIITDLKH